MRLQSPQPHTLQRSNSPALQRSENCTDAQTQRERPAHIACHRTTNTTTAQGTKQGADATQRWCSGGAAEDRRQRRQLHLHMRAHSRPRSCTALPAMMRPPRELNVRRHWIQICEISLDPRSVAAPLAVLSSLERTTCGQPNRPTKKYPKGFHFARSKVEVQWQRRSMSFVEQPIEVPLHACAGFRLLADMPSAVPGPNLARSSSRCHRVATSMSWQAPNSQDGNSKSELRLRECQCRHCSCSPR